MTRHILVTGANKGIGLALCREILEQHSDTNVFLGSRDAARGEAAANSLGAEGRVIPIQLDVSSDASVSSAAEKVKSILGDSKLYAVVNNAGAGEFGGKVSDAVDVNTIGVKRVVDAFLPVLDPASGRVAMTSSAAGPNFIAKCGGSKGEELTDASVTWLQVKATVDEVLAMEAAGAADGDFESKGYPPNKSKDPMFGYGLSKALLNAYTLHLAREHPSLHINACTPGFIETDLSKPLAEHSGKTAKEMGMKTPKEGTVALMRLIFGDVSGNWHYYGSDALRSPLHKYRGPGDPEYEP
mmetsp:Transcript_3923/g.9883  ORF Transcript_3923/g.9883 Transcript_3923/m.9883 type:complete len:298 (+) Transcript_3923:126-1019(+)